MYEHVVGRIVQVFLFFIVIKAGVAIVPSLFTQNLNPFFLLEGVILIVCLIFIGAISLCLRDFQKVLRWMKKVSK